MRYYNPTVTQAQSTYVPVELPWDAIAKAGAQKQATQDKNKGDLENLLNTKLSNIQYHDNAKQAIIQDFQNQAGELINGVDLTQPGNARKVNSIINNYRNNPDLQILERSTKNYEEQQKDIAALKKEKGAYAYYNDPTKLDQKRFEAGDNPYEYTDQNGKPRAKEFVYRPVQRAEDHQGAVEDIYNNIKESGKLTDIAAFSGDKTYIESNKKGWEGVSDATIKEATKRNVGTFLNSSAGQDWTRKFEFDNYEALSNLTPEQQQTEQANAAYNYMYDIGTTFKHGKSTSGNKIDATVLMGKKYDDDKLANTNAGTEVGNPTAQTTKSLLDTYDIGKYFDNDGKLNVSSNPLNLNVVTFVDKNNKQVTKTFNTEKERIQGELDMEKQGNKVLERKADPNSYQKNLDDVYKKTYTLAKKLNLDVSSGNAPKVVYDYMQNIAKSTSKTATILDDVSTGLTKSYAGKNSNLHNMEIYNQGDASSNTKVTEEEINTLGNNTKITGVDFNSPKQAGFKLAVTPKEGDASTGVDKAMIAVPRDQQFKNQTEPIWKITRGATEYAFKGELDPKFDDVSSKGTKNEQEAVKDIVKQSGGKYAGSSIENLENGVKVIRAVTHKVIDNEPQNSVIKITLDNNGNLIGKVEINTLEAEQEQKVQDLNKPGGAFYKHIVNIKSDVKE